MRSAVAAESVVVEYQGCQMAKFDPLLSLDCARVEGVGGTIQGKEGIKFCSLYSRAISEGPNKI